LIIFSDNILQHRLHIYASLNFVLANPGFRRKKASIKQIEAEL